MNHWIKELPAANTGLITMALACALSITTITACSSSEDDPVVEDGNTNSPTTSTPDTLGPRENAFPSQ